MYSVSILKKIARPAIKFMFDIIFGELITKKPLPRTKFYLHYPIANNLLFLFKKSAFYEEDIKSYISKKVLVSKDDTVFDIGANIGQYMLFFSELVGPKGNVVSFEPNPESFKLLSLNKVLNGVSNVVLCDCAVGQSNDRIELGLDEKTGGRTSSTIDQEGFTSTVTVDQITLKDAVEAHGIPDFVKVDIEGAELNIFPNRDIILNLPKTIFLIEVREDTKHGVLDVFRGYKCFCVEANKIIKVSSEIPSFANLFLFPPIK